MTLLQAAKSLRDAQRKYMTLRSGSKMASLEDKEAAGQVVAHAAEALDRAIAHAEKLWTFP